MAKVREYLTERRWTKGAMFRNYVDQPVTEQTGKCCLTGALIVCYPNIEERYDIFSKIEAELPVADNRPRGYGPIPWWNDQPERKFADVKALVEKLDV